MSDRVMIFIDGSNLYHSLRDVHGRTSLDYTKFVGCLANDRDLKRTYYYGALVDQTRQPKIYQDQQRFLAVLRGLPYFEVRLGYLVYRGGQPIEKGIDVRLATDMLTRAYKDHFDVAILVSGDNDFTDLVQAVKDQGKHVEAALFDPPTSSRQLREAADKVTVLDAAFLANCWR